jgi:hypothetical protein
MQDSGRIEITRCWRRFTLSGDKPMKRMLIAAGALLVTTSLLAAEEKKPVQTTTTPAASDSPLVAAAKKGKRLDGKKRIVITEETLKTSTGHLTTTKTIQDPPNIPPHLKTPAEVMEETKAKEKERAAVRVIELKATEAARQKRIAETAARAEEDGGMEEDPATTEHQMDQATAPPAGPQKSTNTSSPKKQ